jgi:hypothetical protein
MIARNDNWQQVVLDRLAHDLFSAGLACLAAVLSG